MKGSTNWKVRIGMLVLLVITVSVFQVPIVTADVDDALVVNINTADMEKLTLLPGIGTSKANAIIEYRSVNGPFESVEELANIRGIGNNILEKIREYIRTN